MRILEGDGYDFNLEEEKPVPPPDGEDRNISGVIEEQGQKFKDAERNLARAQTAPFNVLARLLKDNNEVAKEIFNETFKQGTRYKAIETVYNNLTNPTVKGKATKEETLDRNLNDPKGVGVTDKQRDAMIEAGIEPLPTWGYYLKEADPDWDGKSEPTSDQVEAAYIARAGDSREFTDPKTGQPTSVGNLLTPADPKRYISNAIGELRKAAVEGKIELDSDDRKAVVNQQREIAKYREESVNALNEMHDDLNEFTVKNENGEDVCNKYYINRENNSLAHILFKSKNKLSSFTLETNVPNFIILNENNKKFLEGGVLGIKKIQYFIKPTNEFKLINTS